MTDNSFYDYPASAFPPDTRIELHPATDLWMRGARYGTVIRAARLRVTVKLDSLPRPVILMRAHMRPVTDD